MARVTIRLAGPDDFDVIIFGANAFARQANLTHLVDGGLEASVTTLLELDVVRIYLAETDHIVGGLGVSVQPFLWNMQLTEMSELFFWVHPGAPVTAALVLLRRAMADAEAERIDIVTFVSLATSSKKVGRIYERLGFKPVQQSYMKEFS